MPPGESLSAFGATGATLAIHLSIHNLAQVVRDLIPHHGADCPAAAVWRASWPDQRIVRATPGTLGEAAAEGPERNAIIMLGDRTSVEEGKRVSVRVDVGGRRHLKQQQK